MSARNTIIFRIQNRNLWSVIWNFPNNAFEHADTSAACFETAEFSCIVGLTTIFYVYYKGKFSLFLIYSVYCCLSERRMSPESSLAICHLRASCL